MYPFVKTNNDVVLLLTLAADHRKFLAQFGREFRLLPQLDQLATEPFYFVRILFRLFGLVFETGFQIVVTAPH